MWSFNGIRAARAKADRREHCIDTHLRSTYWYDYKGGRNSVKTGRLQHTTYTHPVSEFRHFEARVHVLGVLNGLLTV